MTRLDSLLSRAASEVGYAEKKSNLYLDDKTANAGSGNFTKYARDYSTWINSNFQAQPWCAMFLSWLFVQEYGLENAKEVLSGNLYASCTMCVNSFRSRNQFFISNPQVGDLIIFTDSSGEIAHVGIVEKISATTIYTIEGNTSGSAGVVVNGGGVYRKSYAVSNSRIYGFCRPNYEAFPKEDVVSWKLFDGVWKCFENDVVLTEQWVRYKNRWFYLDGSGAMLTGIQTINGRLYFLNSDVNAGTDFGALMVTTDLNQGDLVVQMLN